MSSEERKKKKQKHVTADLNWFLYVWEYLKLTSHASSSEAEELLMGVQTERHM